MVQPELMAPCHGVLWCCFVAVFSAATRVPLSAGHGVPAASVAASNAASHAVGLVDCGRQIYMGVDTSTRAGTVTAQGDDGNHGRRAVVRK